MGGSLWGLHKPLLGVVHLRPLPGAPRYKGTLEPVLNRALEDARAYLDAGLDGLVVENYGDAPFHPDRVGPETVAAMTRMAAAIRELGDFPLGVNVLRSDGVAALAVATAARAEFIRVNVLAGAMVTDQGIIQGRADQVARARAAWASPVAVWADLLVKHAQPVAPLEPGDGARDLVERALADAVIVTGSRTGTPVDGLDVGAVRNAVPRVPLIIGSGVTPRALETFWHLGDGFIVGTALKKGRRTEAAVDPNRARQLVEARRKLLKQGTRR